MTIVKMYQASDLTLHKTFESYSAHESSIRIREALAAASFNTSFFFANTDAGSDSMVLDIDDLPKFLADNAEVLRKVLNESAVVKRGRKSGRKSEESAQPVAAA